MGTAVVVEEVTSAKARARFVELPVALHGADPRFATPVLAWERSRLDWHRNPFFEAGDAVYLLARRWGRPVGRVTAQVAGPGSDGGFGFWCVDDDAEVAAALVEAAVAWLAERGCTSMTGPWCFGPDDDAGLLVEGTDVPGLTGRAWHPRSQAQLLEALGFQPAADRATWRLAVVPGRAPDPGGAAPGEAGPYGDPRLVLPVGAAVPDLSRALRGARGLRGARVLARRTRAGEWDTAVVVRCDADPAVAVPALASAAGAAGYRWLVAPWTPEPGTPPETVHRTFRLRW